MSKEIVITGEGIISAIGNDKESVFSSLRNGTSGIGKIKFINSEHKELPAGEVKLSNAQMQKSLGLDESILISRTTLLGIWAVKQAIADAHISKGGKRIVLISGTTVGGMDLTESVFDSLQHSDDNLKYLKQHDCGSSTENIANYFGIFDDYTTVSTACSAAANAIILGARLIKSGEADMVIAGGTEALSRFHLNGFNSLMILDKEQCRPFDESRVGLNLGEGAAFVVMESEQSAVERKADIHAYFSGYGNACDAFHQTASSEDGEGSYLAMKEALDTAGITPSQVNYVNAHGTGTANNDMSESAALQRIFGETLPYISSTKSYTGHTTSASGGIELVICILAMRESFIPANLGWKSPMANGIIPINKNIESSPLSIIMCNSFGFGGNDSSLIISSHALHEKPAEISENCNIKIASKVEINSIDELSEIKTFIKPIEARRMGKLMKASLLSSLKALKEAGINTPDAIITGTTYGCLENSEQLLVHINNEGEQAIKPTLFIYSTHNTISSNIAIHTHCHGYNITYTQQQDSLKWAIHDAELLLHSGKVKNVLVGCHDESTPLFNSLMKRMGLKEKQSINSISMVLVCGD